MYVFDLEDISSSIRPYFENVIIRRGWNYYLDRVVRGLQKNEFGYEAMVRGTTPYRVQINLYDFPSSSCTCPYDDYCKHMAAVLFQSIESEGQPAVEFLHPKVIRKANELSPRQNSLRTKKPAVMMPNESDSVEEWHRFFTARVEKRSPLTAYSYDSTYRIIKQELDALCRSWEPAKQGIYRIHVWLFLMNWIEGMYRHTKDTYVFYDNLSFLRTHALRWLNEFIEFMSDVVDGELFNKHEPYMLSTIDYLATHAFHEHDPITDWMFVYGYIWNVLLFHKPWVEQEKQRLQRELAQPQPSVHRQDALKKALVFFDIMYGNDQQAMQMASTLQTQDVTWCFPHLRSFLNHEKWSRLTLWLQWMKPMIKDVERDVLQKYLDFWHAVGHREQVEELQWEQTLRELLPASASEYATYLKMRGKYHQWVDLLIYLEISPTDLRPGDLKEVEAHDRRLLLPLYHQAAERYIHEKNRESYKKAVKLLKKLKTHYKKLHEESRWGHYFETLSTEYKRLRAFQEELQKGKLIP